MKINTDAEGNTTILTGEPGDDYIAIGNYTTYVSPYIVVGANNMVTTHYYSGTERIASRLGGHVCEYSNLSEEELSTDLDQKQVSDLKSVMTDFGIAQFTISAETPDPEDCHLSGDCPTNLYFYHPDHFGSSNFLTDESGNPYQFFMYLPFGETMIEQRASGAFTPYKYNAKEMDEETGLYYYGARYYDARLSRFLSVDRYASKYPGQSPYNYVANNPIRFIDPTGDTIDVPNNARMDQTLNDLAKIYATPEGKKRIDLLQSSERTFTINGIDGDNPLDNEYSALRKKVTYTQGGADADGLESSSYTLLAHELDHAYKHELAMRKDGALKGTWNHATGSKRAGESQAVRFGNYIREIYGGGTRYRYGGLGQIFKESQRMNTNGLRINSKHVFLGDETRMSDGYFSKRLRNLQVLRYYP